MGRVVNVGEDAAKGGTIKPIPSGTIVTASVYAIDEVAVKSGANQGKPQLDVTFKIQGGEWNGREIRYQKLPLYESGGAWKLVSFAEAVGWPHKGGNVELPDNITSVLGKTLNIKLQEDAPNLRGQVFNSVSGYAPASDVQAAATPTADASPSWAALNK
jgi:hypothetical protein